MTWLGLCSPPSTTWPLWSPSPAARLSQGRIPLETAQPSLPAWLQPDTHHSRPREGHLAPIGSPLVLGTILVGKGPLEDLPDILHVVHTDGKSLEHGTAEDAQGQSGQSGCHRWEGAAWLRGQNRGRSCLQTAKTRKRGHPDKDREKEGENRASESLSQGQRQRPTVKSGHKSRGSTEDASVQRLNQGWGYEGRPGCPPDRAKQSIHLEVLP